MSTARLYDIRLVLVVDGCDAAFLEHHVEICVFPNSLGLALHLFFLIVFRSPNLGKTMFDFLPRRLTTLPFFALLDFAVVSISIAAGTRRKSASAVPHVYHSRGAGRDIYSLGCSLTVVCLLLLVGLLVLCLWLLCGVFHFLLWYRLRLRGKLE